MKRKSITWLKLYERIGNQKIAKTKNNVNLIINGCRYEVALVFEKNGDFHLEPTVIVKDMRKLEV